MKQVSYRLCLLSTALMVMGSASLAQETPARDLTITGRVTSQAGAPLAGATVFLQGLNIGTQTGEDGSYSFTVGASRATGQSATLIARVIGYAAQTVQITLTAGQTITQNFSLAINPMRLGEIVITGAGTSTTREKLATSISTVDSSMIRRATAPQNIVSALAGTAPNVEIRTQSGDPGASASIRIRGASTVLGTNQPLFVVDGQPINNDTEATTGDGLASASLGGTVSQNRAADINPSDIESIEILKGSAASAIYGARAANGVVLITTKSGRSGPTRYTISSTNTWDMVKPAIALQREFGQGINATAPADCAPAARSACLQFTWGPQLSAGTPTYDHLTEIYRTGLTSDNNLSVSGGNDRTTFYASGGLTAQRGAMVGPNNKYNRTSVRLKASHQMNGELNIGGNFNYIDSRGRYVQKGSNTSGLLLGALRTPPNFNNEPYLDPVTGLHRSYRYPTPLSGSERTSRGYDNPFFVLANTGNRSELGRSIANINADWTPLEWLSVKYTLGADYYNDWRLETLPLTSSSAPIGRVFRNDFNNLDIDHNLIAVASHDFNENFQGRLTLGQNLNSQRLRQIYILGDRLNAAAPYAIQNTINFVPTENRSLSHIEAYFGQAELDMFDQVFFTASLRNDGFSTFGESNRRAWYPKASASWIFTRAYETNDEGIMNFGKLRVAYGETGQQPPVYASVTALSSEVQFGSGFSDILNINQSGVGGLGTYWIFGNPDLKPERQKEFEVGADFGFFQQKLDLGITYYNKQSRDVIIRVPINAAQTGGLEQYANAASLSNKGIELTLNGRPYESEKTGVELGFSFAKNRGKVLNLAGAEFIGYNTEGFNGSGGSSTVGYAPGVIRGNDFVRCGRGLIVDGVNIDAECASRNAPNGALYLDADGWPMEDVVERVIADPNPKYMLSFNGSIRFLGKFRLSTLFDIRKGGQVWNGTRGALYTFGTHADTRVRTGTGRFGQNFLVDMYPNATGPGANVDAFTSYTDWQDWFTSMGGSGGTQQQFVEDGSFVKWRELSLSYTLDQPFIRNRIGFSSADIRIAGRNLVTWTKYRGLDPEANLQGAQTLTQGVDYFNNPQTRSFVLSISLNR